MQDWKIVNSSKYSLSCCTYVFHRCRFVLAFSVLAFSVASNAERFCVETGIKKLKAAFRISTGSSWTATSHWDVSHPIIVWLGGLELVIRLPARGTLKMRDMKLRDMKMRHQNARVENARHENARNAKVWNTACCTCLSIAERLMMLTFSN